jgi:hypothetical protein
VQKFDPGGTQLPLIVAALLAEIDDGANAVLRRQLRRAVHREAASERHMVREPMQIRRPFVRTGAHSFFLIFFCTSIFFFIIR